VATARVERLRERSTFVDNLLATLRKAKLDGERRLAAEVTYYAFFSIFPLLLVFVTVVDAVFRAKTKEQIVNSAVSQFPVIGEDLVNSISSPQGRGVATVIGLLTALWAGTHAFESFEHAIQVVWRGPGSPPLGFVKSRLRALLLMAIVGGAILAATLLGSILSRFGLLPLGLKPLTAIATLALNTGVILVCFAVVTPGGPHWREQLPGAVLGGVGWTVLQTVGALFVDHVIRGASNTYGTFAVVIGLLTWINLVVRFLLYAAEMNSVLAARRAEAGRAEAGRGEAASRAAG
jgi:membrane protein